MGLTGDFGGLAKAAAQFSALPSVVAKIATAAAPKIKALVQREFASATDPDGDAWAALAESTVAGRRASAAGGGRRDAAGKFLKKKAGHLPLTNTGHMRDSAQVVATGYEIRASVDSPAEYHQGGTGSMPARPVLPEGGLPGSWDDAITAAARRALPKGAL